MRLCIVSPEPSVPFDEGIKNFVRSSTRVLEQENTVLALTTNDRRAHPDWVRRFNRNRMFLNRSFLRMIEDFHPEAVLYVPSSSATILGFLRSRVLKSHSKGAKVVLIALQARRYSFIARALIPLTKPDLVLTQSRDFREALSELGCSAELVPSGVDLARFRPADSSRKLELRNKHRLETDKFLILHVGHINRNRNVRPLAELQNSENQILLIGRESVPQDRLLIDQLHRARIRVLTDYVENIEELYQLSDCYVFPVEARDAAIDIPLSVLEAMACNLPVVTTRYGGLPSIFQEGNGLFYLDHLAQLGRRIEAAKRVTSVTTRRLVQPFSWERVAQDILDSLGDRRERP